MIREKMEASKEGVTVADEAMLGDITAKVPVSFLQEHGNVGWFLDAEASGC